MIERLKELYGKYREIISYLFFGVVTTVVSLGAWYLTMKVGVLFLSDGNGQPTTLLDAVGSTVQWVVGVAVAFVTNKLFVFTDAEKGIRKTAGQLATFTASRVMTYFMEMGLNIASIWAFQTLGYKAFEVFGFNVDERIWAKVITSVAVTVANYVISKLLVFRKEKKAKEK